MAGPYPFGIHTNFRNSSTKKCQVGLVVFVNRYRIKGISEINGCYVDPWSD